MPVTEAPAPTHVQPTQFSRYADVARALHHPKLVPHGSAALTAGQGPSPHAALHAAVHQALAPPRLAKWRDACTAHAQALVAKLPDGAPVDLVTALADPWALELALVVTGAPREHALTHPALPFSHPWQ